MCVPNTDQFLLRTSFTFPAATSSSPPHSAAARSRWIAGDAARLARHRARTEVARAAPQEVFPDGGSFFDEFSHAFPAATSSCGPHFAAAGGGCMANGPLRVPQERRGARGRGAAASQGTVLEHFRHLFFPLQTWGGRAEGPLGTSSPLSPSSRIASRGEPRLFCAQLWCQQHGTPPPR